MKPYYDHAGVTIYHADCRELMPTLSADVVLTDPPYNAKTIGKLHRNYLNSGFPLPEKEYAEFCSSWFAGARAVSSRLAFTPGIYHVWLYPPPAWVLCWHKPSSVSYNATGGFNVWEPILVYGRCPNRFTHDYYRLVPQNLRKGPERNHPCPKPLELLLWLIIGVSNEKETVLDPFSGSGTTLLAAKRLGRKAVCIEIEEEYCEMAATRLSQDMLDLEW